MKAKKQDFEVEIITMDSSEEKQLVARIEDAPKNIIKVDIVKSRKTRKGLKPTYLQQPLLTSLQQERQRQIYYAVYKKYPWVRAFINKIARLSITVGWFVKYVGEGEANEKSLKSITKFFESPSYQASFPDVLFKTIVQLKLFAESYWEIVSDKDKHPVDFYVLDGYVRPNVDKHGNPENPAYTQRVYGEEAEFKFNEVLWFKNPDPVGALHPSSDLESLELSILLDMNAMTANRTKETKGTKGTKLFIFPADTGEEEMKRNRNEIDNKLTGVTDGYKPAIVIEGDVKVEDLDPESNQEMEYAALRKYCRDEISAVLGVPLPKMGVQDVEAKESQFITKAFYEEEVKPNLDLIENTINRYFDLIGITDYRFKFKAYHARDLKETARLLDVLKKHGTASVNEIRELAGLEPIKGGDRLFVMLKDGQIVFTDDILAEADKNREAKKAQTNLGHGFTYKMGGRKIVRGSEFPVAEEEELEDGEDLDPFVSSD